MNTRKICPSCQKALIPNAPDGLCPECLVKAGLPTGMDLGPESRTGEGRAPFAAPPAEELAKLFPQLEILGFIGQGGMGAVYRARQKELDRVVALKVLPPDIGRDGAFAERFAREARALAKLNHAGIVTLYEFGRADGLFFFLMEFVDGVNLRQLLEHGRLAPREALAIVPQICDALQYAHDQGIVHRDIKPENILLDRQGRVKLADFGVAKLVGRGNEPDPGASADAGVISLTTEAGKVMGTPQYMAPEQRERPLEVDHRADIYSLGVVFYQMLTGELPASRIDPPSSKVRIDVRLDEVVLRALEKEPERRYQQVSEVKTFVETIAATPENSRSSGTGSQPPLQWRIECRKCGHTEHRDRPGIRVGLLGVKYSSYKLRRCSACGHIGWHGIADVRAATPDFGSQQSKLSEGFTSPAIAGALLGTVFYAVLAAGLTIVNALPFGGRMNLWVVAVLILSLPPGVVLVGRWLKRPSTAERLAWLRAWAWIAWMLSALVIGFGLFFFNALLSQNGSWHPATDEAVIVPLTWLGSLLLPVSGWVLWRAAATEPDSVRHLGKGVALVALGVLMALGIAAIILNGFADRKRHREAIKMRDEQEKRQAQIEAYIKLDRFRPQLRSGNSDARKDAVLSIYNLRHLAEPAIPELIHVLSCEDKSVRVLAAATLGGLLPGNRPDVTSALTRALKDANQTVRHNAALALIKQDPNAAEPMPVFMEVLTNRPPDDAAGLWPICRREALEALGKMGGRAAAALPLLRSLTPDRMVQDAILQIDKPSGKPGSTGQDLTSKAEAKVSGKPSSASAFTPVVEPGIGAGAGFATQRLNMHTGSLTSLEQAAPAPASFPEELIIWHEAAKPDPLTLYVFDDRIHTDTTNLLIRMKAVGRQKAYSRLTARLGPADWAKSNGGKLIRDLENQLQKARRVSLSVGETLSELPLEMDDANVFSITVPAWSTNQPCVLDLDTGTLHQTWQPVKLESFNPVMVGAWVELGFDAAVPPGSECLLFPTLTSIVLAAPDDWQARRIAPRAFAQHLLSLQPPRMRDPKAERSVTALFPAHWQGGWLLTDSGSLLLVKVANAETQPGALQVSWRRVRQASRGTPAPAGRF